jgi:hypothetical protein
MLCVYSLWLQTVCGVLALLLLVAIPYYYIQTYKVDLQVPVAVAKRYGIELHRFPIYRVPRDIKHLAPFLVGFMGFGTLYLRLARPRKNSSQPRPASKDPIG